MTSSSSSGLKATFRHNIKDCAKIYPLSPAILLISPGQPYHEGEKLTATIDLINRSNFSHCVIVIGDTAYRHTLKITHDIPQEKLYDKAKKIGDEWILVNQIIIDQLQVPYSLTRWDEWICHPNYSKNRQIVDYFFETDLDFKKSFENSAGEFVDRIKDNILSTYDQAVHLSIEYLKEECTVIMPMFAEMNFNIMIYPSNMLEAMAKTYEKIVVPKYGNNLTWLTLRYKRKINVASTEH